MSPATEIAGDGDHEADEGDGDGDDRDHASAVSPSVTRASTTATSGVIEARKAAFAGVVFLTA